MQVYLVIRAHLFSASNRVSNFSRCCVQALEKLAHEQPQSCLNNGGLMAVLTYLDFFQTGVQRVAVATAAHMTRGITRDATETAVNAIPLLTPLLQYKVCGLP